MQRVTLRIPEQQVDAIDELVDAGDFPNRSEGIRTAVRDLLHDHEDVNGQFNYTPTPEKTGWSSISGGDD